VLLGLLALADDRMHAQVSAARLLNAAREPQNWLIYSGGYFSNRTAAQSDHTGERERPSS
jgi:hypothetical protein